MPDQRKWEAFWSSLSVEERAKHIDNREISPSLRAMSEAIEERRRSGSKKREDMVPHFVAAFLSSRERRNSNPRGSEEANAGHFAMQNVRLSARQQLSRKDFERFRKGIGELK